MSPECHGARPRTLIAVALVVALGGSCIVLRMPGHTHRGPLLPLDAAGEDLATRLHRHVESLGGEIGERNLGRPRALAAARRYVLEAFGEIGLAVREQTFRVNGMEVANVEVVLEGRATNREIVVVGAHYDSAPGSPGANDNATGVATVLELARLLQDR
ncbi:MAG: M28 family peptidase, partial [Pseudomonadota bacterium]